MRTMTMDATGALMRSMLPGRGRSMEGPSMKGVLLVCPRKPKLGRKDGDPFAARSQDFLNGCSFRFFLSTAYRVMSVFLVMIPIRVISYICIVHDVHHSKDFYNL